MNNSEIQKSGFRRCYSCRQMESMDKLYRHEGRWYHTEYCGRKSHPKHQVQESITKVEEIKVEVEEDEEFLDFEESNIEFEPIQKVSEKKTYIITSAVQNVPVHSFCFKTLQNIASFYNAELLIVPIKYHYEKNSPQTWDSRISPYVCKKSIRLNDNITLHAQVNINPTAINPTSGMEVFCGTSSGIFAHTKLELKAVPTPLSKLPKLMMTTGAVTSPVFSETKTGEKGYAAHHLGGLIVEIEDDKIFHVRQLTYKEGVIYDLDQCFDPAGNYIYSGISGLVLGDAHFGFIDPQVFKAIFTDAHSLVAQLDPKNIVWHDYLDAYSICHHHKNPFQKVAKKRYGKNNIEKEVMQALKFFEVIHKFSPDTRHILVESNHNNHLDQWLANSDWKEDPENARFYLKLASLLADKAEYVEGYGYTNVGAFQSLFEDEFARTFDYKFVYDDDTHFIEDILVNYHGHNGANGSRGSALQFGRSGYKYFTGHTHTPTIRDNCWTVGTMRHLNCEYLKGLSSWMNTMGLIYPNGARALVNIVNGKYTMYANW